MRLYLVRHGKAVPEVVDPEKNLSEEGKEQAQKVADFLKKAGVEVAHVYHSGKARAQQTAEILAQAVQAEGSVDFMEGITPMDEVLPIIESLGSNDTMLVGHNPFMSKMAYRLITGKENAHAISFKAAACVCLSNEADDKRWQLEFSIQPGLL